jgi:hypothetical protein
MSNSTQQDANAQALRDSWIPSAYHTTSIRLADKFPAWSQHMVAIVKQARSSGGWFHLMRGGREGTDLAYLVARSMVVGGLPSLALSLPRLCDLVCEKQTDANPLTDRRGIVLLGFSGDMPKNPLPEEKAYRVEWFLRSWLSHGNTLVTHGAAVPAKWWGADFTSTLKGYQIETPEATQR